VETLIAVTYVVAVEHLKLEVWEACPEVDRHRLHVNYLNKQVLICFQWD